MNNWLYTLLCLTVPAAWSVALHFVFRYVERRRRQFDRDDKPPVDYSI